MKNLSKEKRDRLILISLGTAICALVLWYVVIKAQQNARDTVRKEILEQQSKVENAQRLLTSTTEVQKQLELSTKELKSLEEGMASGDMYSWIILTINKFRADRKVEIPQFSREVPTDVGVMPKFPYRAALFNVRGTAYFHDFGKFLADFENTFPYIRVQNLELEPAASSSATSTGDPEKLAFKMEIVTLINPTAAR
jgi:Tfp pilus assembly protein PilO